MVLLHQSMVSTGSLSGVQGGGFDSSKRIFVFWREYEQKLPKRTSELFKTCEDEIRRELETARVWCLLS